MIFSRKDKKVSLSLSAKIAVICSAVVLSVAVAGAITFDALSANVVVKNGGGMETEVFTFENTVEEVLKSEGITLGKYDKVNHDLKAKLSDDMTIEVYRSLAVSVTAGGETKTIHTTKRLAKDILADAGYEVNDEDEVKPGKNKVIKANTNIVLIKKTKETITVMEETPFATTETPNNSLNRGIKKVVSKGETGKSERTYEISYADGVEVSRKILKENIISPAKNEVVEVGTKKTNMDTYTVAYGGSITTSRNGSFSYSRVLNCEATAYDAVSCGKKPGEARTATGAIAQRGVIAVDPRVIPLGTRVYVEGYGYAIAADTGGAIKGNIIDLCFDTRAESLQYGRRKNIKVYILD